MPLEKIAQWLMVAGEKLCQESWILAIPTKRLVVSSPNQDWLLCKKPGYKQLPASPTWFQYRPVYLLCSTNRMR